MGSVSAAQAYDHTFFQYPTYSLVLAVAISFGTLDVLGHIAAATYSGRGRVAKGM